MDKQDFLHVTEKSLANLVNPDGKYLHWVSRIDEEIPIPMKASGFGSERPLSIIDILQEAKDQEPQQEALRVKREGKWVSWSYAEYYDLAHRFARSMISLGIEGRRCVNIIGFNSPEWVIAFIGASLADCVPVGVYTTSGPEAVQHIANHSEAELIILQNEELLNVYLKVIQNMPTIKALVVYNPRTDLSQYRRGYPQIISWDDYMSRGTLDYSSELEARKAIVTPSRVATIIYTSGTTGPPKGVLLSHDNYVWTSRLLIEASGIRDKNEQCVSYLPLSHVAAQVTDIIGCLVSKACINFADERALQGTLGETLKEVRPTFFLGVPRVYEKIEEKIKAIGAASGWLKMKIATWAKEIGHRATLANLAHKPNPWGYCIANSLVFQKVKEALGLDRAKVLFVSAAPVSKATLDFFASLNITLLNIYGMSEAAGPMTTAFMHRCNLYSAGFALPSTTLAILDEQGRVLPNGTRGEVCYKGRNKFLGYYKDPEATKACVDPRGYLHSGDEGYVDDEGFLFITGRFKELIITAGGENIPPVLIEQTIKAGSKLISNVFVVGDGKKYLGALITLRSEPDADGLPTQQLANDLRSHIEELGSSAQTIDQAVEDPKIYAAVDRAVQAANEHSASRAQYVRKWSFLTGDFTISGGELTPTMKVRRRIVTEKYRVEIEKLYEEPHL